MGFTRAGGGGGVGGGPSAAENVAFTPAGNVEATDVQAAIEEVDASKFESATDVVQSFAGIPDGTKFLKDDGTLAAPDSGPSNPGLTRFIARSPLDRGVRDATGGGVNASGVDYTVFTLEHTQVIDRVLIEVKTAAGNIDVGIYDDDGTAGAPGTKLASSGSVACPAAGGRAVTLTSSIELAPGRYYAALSSNNGSAVFLYSTGMNVDAALGGIRYVQNPTVFPLPSTAANLTEQTGGSAYVILAGKA